MLGKSGTRERERDKRAGAGQEGEFLSGEIFEAKKSVYLQAMKKKSVILFLVVAAVLAAAGLRSPYSAAQNKGQKGVLMAYYIDAVGDTVYYDQLPPVWCFPKGTRRDRKDWRNYYKLVYNFRRWSVGARIFLPCARRAFTAL